MSQRKKRNQKDFSSDDSNDDVATSSFRDSSIRVVSVVAESVASSTFKLTKAKRAKIDTTAANTAIIELADAVKIAFQARTTFITTTSINHEIAGLNDRIFRLKDEMKTAKKDRELQNETLAKILEAVQKK